MRELLVRADRLLDVVERVMLVISVLSLFAIAFLVMSEILARFFPILLVPDSIVMVRGLLLLSITFGLGHATMTRGHIAVDLFFNMFSAQVRKICILIGMIAGLAFCLPLAIWVGLYTLEVYAAGRTYFGLLRLPHWPNYLALTLGFMLINLRLTQQLLSAAAGTYREDEGGHHGQPKAE